MSRGGDHSEREQAASSDSTSQRVGAARVRAAPPRRRRPMSEYGALFTQAYAILHGEGDDLGSSLERRPGEHLGEYLARQRKATVARVQAALREATPPPALTRAHEILVRLLANAWEADEALLAQTQAYHCGRFETSATHADRLHALVTESARLDRELIAALQEVERAAPGTLEALGMPVPG